MSSFEELEEAFIEQLFIQYEEDGLSEDAANRVFESYSNTDLYRSELLEFMEEQLTDQINYARVTLKGK
jgi:hypothetical protein